MRKPIVGDLIRSLTAIVGLAALVVGLPVALTAARGWPLPSSVPSIDGITHALAGATISDAVLLDALACLCWIAWAVLTGCVVVELLAWARSRAASRVPGAGALQLLARRLVVSATFLLSASRVGTSPSLAATVTPIAAVVTPTPAPAPVGAPKGADVALPTCTVQPRDSLWRIAERHLGDPFRWREIYELNHGRSFSDGRILQDPDLIHPGWELRLPADAVDAVQAAATVAPSPPTTRHVEQAAPPTSAATAVVDAPQLVDRKPVRDATDAIDDDDADDSPFVPGRLAATTLVLAGAVTAISGLRRRQRRLREPGRMIRLPGPATLRAERSVRAAADLEGADRLDLALRALASEVVDAPTIDAVRVHDGEVEVLFSEPATGESGLFEGNGTRAWLLPASTSTGELAKRADRGCIAPALVCIGRADAGDVLVDLEAGGPITVHGDAGDVTALLWSIVLDLATHGWADDVRVVVHGLDHRGLVSLDRIEVAPDLDALVRDVEEEARAREAALLSVGASSTWDARLTSLGDGWTPTVAVLGPHVAESDAVAAMSRLEGCAGVALVIGSTAEAPVDGQRRLLVSRGRGHVALLPLDLVLQPTVLPDDVLAAVDDLIEVAASDDPGDLLLTEQDPDVIVELREPDHELAASSVLVRIMGRVEIEGGKTPIDRRRVIEFVTLLALHPRGLTEGQIKAALWTDQEPSTNAFNQTVSRARVALGLDSSGQPHVRYVEDSLYKPGAELITDWSILEHAWMRATTSASPASLEALQQVLESARGLPFEGTKGYEWAYESALPARIEAVVDEARRLVQRSPDRAAAS